jgi:hypothetical protein
MAPQGWISIWSWQERDEDVDVLVRHRKGEQHRCQVVARWQHDFRLGDFRTALALSG